MDANNLPCLELSPSYSVANIRVRLPWPMSPAKLSTPGNIVSSWKGSSIWIREYVVFGFFG